MSGAWNVVEKKSPGGSKYKSYWDKMLVLVPTGKTQGFLITPKVREKLGDPEHVLVMTSGTKVGIMASTAQNSNSYTVQHKERMARVSCRVGEIMPTFPYPVTYEVIMDGEVAVFDASDAEKVE